MEGHYFMTIVTSCLILFEGTMKVFIIALITLISSFSSAQDSTYRLSLNKIDFPLDKYGILGDVLMDGRVGARLDSHIVIFSAGFYLGGKDGDSIWVNAVASADRITEYLPGNVGQSSNNPLYRLYKINKTDSAFGSSWQNWRDAVSIGAEFYDGNNDSIYNPVDLNNNRT